MGRLPLTRPVFGSGIGNQTDGKKEKTKLEVFRVADIRSYIVDEKGKEYFCNDKLVKDVKKGHFVKARVKEGKIKILAIFG